VRVLTGDVVNAHAGGVVTGVPEPAGIVEAGEGRLLGDWIRDGVVVCGVPEAGGKGKKGRSANARNRTTTAETFGRHGERRRSAFHAPRAGPATARAAQRRGARGGRPPGRDTRRWNWSGACECCACAGAIPAFTTSFLIYHTLRDDLTSIVSVFPRGCSHPFVGAIIRGDSDLQIE